MNQRPFLIAGMLLLTGCSLLFSSPSSVVKNLMTAAEGEDVDAMVALWGTKAIEEQGAESIRDNAKSFVELERKVKANGEVMEIKNLRETIQGDRARVFFIYHDKKGTDSTCMGFALLKESGKWMLYRGADCGEEDQPFDKTFAPKESPKSASTPEPNSSPIEMVAPPPPPANTNSNRKPELNSNLTPPDKANSNSSAPVSKSGAISGGVLNSRAISLPKPAYPSAAKVVKAGGTVNVNVTVDENGRVVSASAVSGHPLLRASAEQAARNARFSPTVIGGQRVKVTGTITYQFSPE